MYSCGIHRLHYGALSDSPFPGGIAKRCVDFDVDLILLPRFVPFGSAGQFIGVVEDLLDAAWHHDHPKNFRRAGIA